MAPDDADTGDRATPRREPGDLTDPSELTDRAIAKAVASLTQYIDGKYDVLAERMSGHWRLDNERWRAFGEAQGQIAAERKDASTARDIATEKVEYGAAQIVARDVPDWFGKIAVGLGEVPDCGVDGCAREVGHIGGHRRDPESLYDPVSGWTAPALSVGYTPPAAGGYGSPPTVRQSVCPCPTCAESFPTEGGCYGSDADRARAPEERCYADGCECWGGPDRECEACWLALK